MLRGYVSSTSSWLHLLSIDAEQEVGITSQVLAYPLNDNRLNACCPAVNKIAHLVRCALVATTLKNVVRQLLTVYSSTLQLGSRNRLS
jgi:hypothetical protein